MRNAVFTTQQRSGFAARALLGGTAANPERGQLDRNGCVLKEIPFGKLRAGSRPAGENAGLRDDANWTDPQTFKLLYDENLKQIPEELIVDVVVILHLGRLHESSQQTGTAIGGRLLQVGVTSLYIFAENFRGPL
jgi:hypothetical protein